MCGGFVSWPKSCVAESKDVSLSRATFRPRNNAKITYSIALLEKVCATEPIILQELRGCSHS